MKKACGLLMLFALAAACTREPRPYLDAALDAAQWIESSATHTDRGTAWPSDPLNPTSVQTNLYSGTPGVVLFFLEAYYATGNRKYLDMAASGSDYLIAGLPEAKGTGFYEGIAGIGFALQETFKAGGDRKYRDAASRCVEMIKQQAVSAGNGVEWSDTTDIISGSAGTGLFLLYAAKELGDDASRDLAVKAGRRLIELGIAEGEGLKWAMSPTYPRLMPNFSHGTAGIAYFLASIYLETKEPEFLEAATSGARYLQSIAETTGDTCLIFHDEPDNTDLYYLGWCHGPTGTARLFYRLYQATGDAAWMEWVRKSAGAVLKSGVPEKQTPGFWNNVSVCCGSAGVAEFFLALHRITRESGYLQFCKRMTDDLLSKATRDASGMRWVQAEHRVRPDFLVAQTGLMQGAAGIGIWLLRLDRYEQGNEGGIAFPDSPF